MPGKAIAIRHLAFEDLGAFAPVLRRLGYEIAYVDAGIDDISALKPLAADVLFVLGGPIGAYEDDKYPFLAQEIRLLEARLAQDLPTFGICLGAQLMARALGAKVHPAPAKEIGFKPITLSPEGEHSSLAIFKTGPVLHWHGDTFELPAGAHRLASTDICANQAFAHGKLGLAVQFHPEAGENGFERWLIGHAFELSQEGIDVAALRADHLRLASTLKASAATCLEIWLKANVQ